MKRQSRYGFSLIELTVVIVIFAVMAVGVAFTLGEGARPEYLIRSVARQTAGKMELARLMSGVTGRLSRIVYDMDRQVMIVYGQREVQEDEDPPETDDIMEYLDVLSELEFGDPEDPDNSPIWLDSVETYDGVSTNSGEVFVDIRSKGTSIGHVVNLRGRPNSATGEFEEFSIDLNPLTGQARIYDYRKKVEKPKRD